MKKLQCEICGGQLMMKDGIAECQSCGMQFSKEEVKKMVVELSGPIKIDGEVKVSGVDDADVLYQRAKDFEKLGDHIAAKQTYHKITSTYPGDYRGWVGLAELATTVTFIKNHEERYFCQRCGELQPKIPFSSPGIFCELCQKSTWWDILPLPKLLSEEELASLKTTGAENVSHYMSQAITVAPLSLQSELEEYRTTLLEQQSANAQQALLDAEAWNQEAQATIDTRCKEQLAQAAERKAEAERQKVEADRQKAEELLRKEQERQAAEQQWAARNGEFLSQFSCAAIAELFGRNECDFISVYITPNEPLGAQWVKQWCSPIELNLTYAFGNRLKGTYKYHSKAYRGGPQTRKGSFDAQVGWYKTIISGDVRPLMDGKEMVVRGLFGTKKVIYHYDPNKP